MNRAAQSLGRLAKGKPKNFSASEIALRTKRLADAREKKKRMAMEKKQSS